jgi:hypothetical protein
MSIEITNGLQPIQHRDNKGKQTTVNGLQPMSIEITNGLQPMNTEITKDQARSLSLSLSLSL